MIWNQCIYCGKLISYSDMDKKKAKAEFTPDTEFTIEKTEWYHVKCAKDISIKKQ